MKYQPFLDSICNKITLTEEEKAILINHLLLKTYLKGQYIVQEGNVCKYQTFIISGKTRTFYLDEEGNEHIVNFGIENWWVGDVCSFTTQTPAEFNAQCLDKTTVVHMTYNDMEYLYQAIPKLERYFRLIMQKAYASMSKRIVRNHAMPARERYLLFIATYPNIAQRVPQYMIASYLGITKEFLSRMRKQIAEEQRS
ncbi:MAG: Crp/Fnr family transcriptional regulator [Aureispira sp.]